MTVTFPITLNTVFSVDRLTDLHPSLKLPTQVTTTASIKAEDRKHEKEQFPRVTPSSSSSSSSSSLLQIGNHALFAVLGEQRRRERYSYIPPYFGFVETRYFVAQTFRVTIPFFGILC